MRDLAAELKALRLYGMAEAFAELAGPDHGAGVEELAAIDEMRPGTLTRQYKDPKSHSGPYYQLSHTRDMTSRTEYIARECLLDVRRQIAN